MRALIVALAIGVAACGGAQMPQQLPDPRDNEITALWTQVRDWRREAHMSLDPTTQDVFQLTRSTVANAKLVCTENHSVPSTCNDVCNLADDICDNAERICQLADQLGKGDDYAQEKCSSAKASCREAKQKCCGCSAGGSDTTRTGGIF